MNRYYQETIKIARVKDQVNRIQRETRILPVKQTEGTENVNGFNAVVS